MDSRKILELPFESENRDRLLSKYHQDFDLADTLIQLGLQAADSLLAQFSDKLDVGFQKTIGALFTQELRRIRSILLVLGHGFLENSEILIRSHFEGLLAAKFILSDPLPLDQCSSELKGIRNKLPIAPSAFPRERFHALLYEASSFFKVANGKEPSDLSDIEKKGILKNRNYFESQLGPEWVKIVTSQPKTYSGMNVKLLAENCGLQSWYDKIYSHLSLSTHSSQSRNMVEVESSVPEVFQIDFCLVTPERLLARLPVYIRMGCLIFIFLMREIDQRFPLNLDEPVEALITKFNDRATST